MHDFLQEIPNIDIQGIDISEYAIQNCMETVKNLVSVADAKKLMFDDNSFDVVISINTIHNLNKDECAEALEKLRE